ncbi:hypothetical protein ACTFIT_012179 [Dictyostelium discoideum]
MIYKLLSIILILIIFNNFYICSLKINIENDKNEDILKKRNLFFYTDANIDDIIALQSILSNDSEFKLRGICVSGTGFTTRAIGLDTIFKVFNFMTEKDNDRYKELLSIPVALGSSIPLDSALNFEISILNATNNQVRALGDTLWYTKDQYFNNNTNGLVPTNMSCTELFVKINKELLELNEPIEILSAGPATDLAILLTLYPNVVDNIELVSQMGGTIDAPANIFTYRNNTVAEFNLFVDIKAFQIMVSSLGPKLLLTPLDATDTNPITKDFFYNEINKPLTYSGQWLQALFTSVKNIITDASFFNIDHIEGQGFYIWDFESYRVLLNRNCDEELIEQIEINDSNSPNNPSGQITLSSASSSSSSSSSSILNKTRICTYINSNSSHSLLSNIYKYKLP